MLLKNLQIENFRCFAEVNLELNGMGLIGVRGRNGAGKSSLLEAIDFALYGQRYGLPSKRSSAGAGEDLRVRVEFEFDARRVEVQRTEHDASLTIDGVPQSAGKDETTYQVTRLLGLSRQQFAATFYARQKEIQSFGDRTTRRKEIERLLGLTQLRRATQLAQEHARRQLVVVETLQAEASEVEKAKRVLEEQRQRAKQGAPLVLTARKRRDELHADRRQTWERLEEAQELATQAERARSAHQLATCEHRAAFENHTTAVAALQTAREAAAEVDRLRPVAGRAAELEAQVREHELRRQAHEAYVAAREARAAVQRKLAALTDHLQQQPAPDPTADELSSSTTQLRAQRDGVSQELQQTTERAATLSKQYDEAQRHDQIRARLTTLDAELAAWPAVQKEEATARARQALLEAQQVEAEHRLDAEKAHREDVKRDGPDAECPRCRRLYGESFQAILAGFDGTISELEQHLASLAIELDEAGSSHQQCLNRLQGLQRLQGERDSLPALDPEAPSDLGAAELAHQKAQQRQLELREALQALSARLASAEADLKDAAERAATRQQAVVQLAALQAEETILSGQIQKMGDVSYDPEVHGQTASQHREALQAVQRCAELRHQAEGTELAEQRVRSCAETAQNAALTLEATGAALTANQGGEEQLEAVQVRLRQLDDAISEAEDQLREAEQRAISEDRDVQAADAAMKRAQAERRKVQAARREHRYAGATADGLHQYTAHLQRNAVPTLEKDTAEFLSRLTANRYADVQLDESGGLAIFDDGAAQPLKRFSGGEQDLANLCLRLALSRAFADQRSADPGLIILDEVFGSQDLDRRQALLEHFRELNKVFSQVFIVSHFDDVADACDIQIQVQRSGKVSTAQLLI